MTGVQTCALPIYNEFPETDSLIDNLRAEQERVKFLDVKLKQLQLENSSKVSKYEKLLMELSDKQLLIPKPEKSNIMKEYENLVQENENLMEKYKFATDSTETEAAKKKSEAEYWAQQYRNIGFKNKTTQWRQQIEFAKKKRQKYKVKLNNAKVNYSKVKCKNETPKNSSKELIGNESIE